MKRTISYCKLFLILFFSIWFNLALGGGESSDKTSATSLGSYKTVKISASPERSAKYKKPSKGDPVEMAYRFFELNQQHNHMINPREELLVESKLTGATGKMHVSFKQVYKGIDILYSHIQAHFDREGRLEEVVGGYIYDINLPTTPSVDSASAVRIALQNMDSTPQPKVVGPGKPVIVSSKIFYPDKEERLYMTWKVEIFPDSTKRFDLFDRFYIDALNGSIVYRDRGTILKR